MTAIRPKYWGGSTQFFLMTLRRFHHPDPVAGSQCQIQQIRWIFPNRGNTVMLSWLWRVKDFMFNEISWACGPKYSLRCLLHISKRKQPKKFSFRKRNPLKSKKMLLVIYPTSAKPIDQSNYVFLLNLAEEYMMAKLTEKCEKFLMYGSEKQTFESPKTAPLCSFLHCLDLLDIAQNYSLEGLQMACVEKAKELTFEKLKQHQVYKNEKITFANYRAIAEGRIAKLEKRARFCGACSQYV